MYTYPVVTGIVNFVNTALVDPDKGQNYSFWAVFGSPKAPVASERAPGAYLYQGGTVWDLNGIFPLKWPGGA